MWIFVYPIYESTNITRVYLVFIQNFLELIFVFHIFFSKIPVAKESFICQKSKNFYLRLISCFSDI